MKNFWIVIGEEDKNKNIYIYIYLKSNKNFIEKIIRLLFFILQIAIIYLYIMFTHA